MGRWRGEVKWGKSEGETNHETVDSEKQTESFRREAGGGLGEPGDGYYGGHALHEAYVVHK